MKKLVVLLTLCTLLLGGCATRSPQGNTVTIPESTDEISLSSETSTASKESSESSEESTPKFTEIGDAEQVAEATEIVATLLERADVCDTIYRGDLNFDENMPLTTLEDKEYRPVLEASFATVDDINAYWSNTFTAETISSQRYAKINERTAYVSMNNELYSLVDDFDEPLTLGDWDIATIQVLAFTDSNIEVSMEASLVGSDAGHNTLTLKNTGGTWRLTDSYFLD